MKNKRISIQLILTLLAVLYWHPLHGFAEEVRVTQPQAEKEYDLILEGVPVEIKPLTKDSAADAIENLPKEELKYLHELVYFEIKKVTRGHVAKLVIEPPSTLSQMKDALDDKNIAGFFDTNKAPLEIERSRFRIAVRNPMDAMGLNESIDMGNVLFRLYFKRYNKESTTYILFYSERVKELETA